MRVTKQIVLTERNRTRGDLIEGYLECAFARGMIPKTKM